MTEELIGPVVIVAERIDAGRRRLSATFTRPSTDDAHYGRMILRNDRAIVRRGVSGMGAGSCARPDALATAAGTRSTFRLQQRRSGPARNGTYGQEPDAREAEAALFVNCITSLSSE